MSNVSATASSLKGVLVDITKCVGCGGCTVACKLWNNLAHEPSSPATGENPVEDQSNWTTVAQKTVTSSTFPRPVLRFVKRQCMHCNEPACVSACFSKAIEKTAQGPVIYHPNLCVGCRYCMLACPFNVPKYEWQKAIPSISKCQMCPSRVENGQAPACTAVCPSGALLFGVRDELISIAKQRIANNSSLVKDIYGELEVGGAGWIYISDIPFADLGFPTLLAEAIPQYTEDYLKSTPPLLLGGAAIFAALSFYSRRRCAIAKLEAEQESLDKPENDSIKQEGASEADNSHDVAREPADRGDGLP